MMTIEEVKGYLKDKGGELTVRSLDGICRIKVQLRYEDGIGGDDPLWILEDGTLVAQSHSFYVMGIKEFRDYKKGISDHLKTLKSVEAIFMGRLP